VIHTVALVCLSVCLSGAWESFKFPQWGLTQSYLFLDIA